MQTDPHPYERLLRLIGRCKQTKFPTDLLVIVALTENLTARRLHVKTFKTAEFW